MKKSKVLYERRGQAPSPSKDYHQLVVTEDSVVLTTWKISLRKESIGKGPVQNKLTHEEFYDDNQLPSAIRNIFGEHVLLHVEGLVHGDWLVRMENSILIKIFTYLDLSDVFLLSRVCRQFHKICNSDMLWKRIYGIHCISVTPEDESLGESMGWKRMFFTNKLQLRKEVSRLRRCAEDGDKEKPVHKLSKQHLTSDLYTHYMLNL